MSFGFRTLLFGFFKLSTYVELVNESSFLLSIFVEVYLLLYCSLSAYHFIYAFGLVAELVAMKWMDMYIMLLKSPKY